MENKKQSHKPESPSQAKKKNNAGSLIAGVILILLILASGMYWYVQKMQYVSTDDAYVDANKLNLSPQIMGRVKALYGREGDKVQKGQLLVALDSSDMAARLQQAQTSLQVARLGIDLAKVRLEQAQINYDRATVQYKGNVIPKAKYDNMVKALQAAKVQYEMAKSKITTLRAQIRVIKTGLSHTKLYSGISGVIAKRWVLAGDVVAPGQTIFTIYNLKNIWVTAMLKETDLSKIALGDTVSLHVDAYPETKFRGKIFQIGTNTAALFSLIPPDNASGNFTKVTQRIPVKISIRPVGNPQLLYGLLPGMSVEIKLKLKGDKAFKLW